MYNPNTLGQYLRAKRQDMKLTLKEVALLSGVPQSALSHIERGDFHAPSIRNLEKISTFYDVPTTDLAKKVDIPSFTIRAYLANRNMWEPREEDLVQ